MDMDHVTAKYQKDGSQNMLWPNLADLISSCHRFTSAVVTQIGWSPLTTRKLTAKGSLNLASHSSSNFDPTKRYPEVLCALDSAGFHWVLKSLLTKT